MDRSQIRDHWTSWAQAHGTDFKATTRGRTAKLLELDAFARRLTEIFEERPFSTLEVGCGNGINCIEMAKSFANATFDGVDFIPEMIDAAREAARAADVDARTRFEVGDVLKLNDLDWRREILI